MTFYVCKHCGYKHTFLPYVCAKCNRTNFYPLIKSEATVPTFVGNGMEIQEDVLKLRIENERLARHIVDLQKDKGELTDKVKSLEEQVEDWKSCHEHQLELINGLNNRIAYLEQAKELIKSIVRVTWGEGWNYSLDVKVRAEKFLQEKQTKNKSPSEPQEPQGDWVVRTEEPL